MAVLALPSPSTFLLLTPSSLWPLWAALSVSLQHRQHGLALQMWPTKTVNRLHDLRVISHFAFRLNFNIIDGLLMMLCSYMQVAWGGTTDKQLAFPFSLWRMFSCLVDKELAHIYSKVTFNQSWVASKNILQGIWQSTLHSNTRATHCTHVCVLDRVCVYTKSAQRSLANSFAPKLNEIFGRTY